jgi:isoquinoline 1-oxidoreductase beta subunit
MPLSSPNRAEFVRIAGSVWAGLVLGFSLPARADDTPAGAAFVPNIWLKVTPDGTITAVISKSEMGQGVIVGLPTILADELDVTLAQLRVEIASADTKYVDPDLGAQATGGSTSVHSTWMPLRQAGATARAMLIAAAAKNWGVDPATCTTRQGVVYDATSARKATYGSLASAASLLPVPQNVPLKDPKAFSLIGHRGQRTDIPLKVNGSATFGIDVRIPGMAYAAIVRSPVFGGRVKSYDARTALAVAGVQKVVQISNGVAVVGKNTWAAFKGKSALKIVWDEGKNANLTSEGLFWEAEFYGRNHTGEHVAISRGEPDTSAGRVLEAVYRGPFLAHATMEPMNCTASVTADRCDVWAPTQVQQRAQDFAAAACGLPKSSCIIHTTFLGGGFGRRLEADYVQEAVEVSKAIGAPVKVTWTREDDIQGDCYRPMSVNIVRGVLANGAISALSHQIVSPSWLRRWAPYPPGYKDGIDALDLLGAIDAPYAVPNFRVSYIDHEHGIPVGSFRAPDANWNTFVSESFMDELAHAAGKDPVAFRLAHMSQSPRAVNVLRLAAERSGWGKPLPKGLARGVAVTFWAYSYAAMVVEVSMADAMPKVHRVFAVVDCGTAVNPDIVVQQAQGATNFGLSAALTGKITIEKGRVTQNNFYDYTVLRMADAPAIEVHIVPSTEAPSGIGELCTPPIGPAVANAVFVLTGKRVRSLPFSDALA